MIIQVMATKNQSGGVWQIARSMSLLLFFQSSLLKDHLDHSECGADLSKISKKQYLKFIMWDIGNKIKTAAIEMASLVHVEWLR